MATRIQVRRGTTTQWTDANTVLDDGEFGFDTTLDKLKIGDGSTAWDTLPFIPTAASLNSSLVDYVPVSELGAANGVAELDGSQNVITASKIVFEGATQDAYELFIQLGEEPIADVTLTLPTATGTLALTSDISAGDVTTTGVQTLTNKTLTSPVISGLYISDSSIVIEGSSADSSETTLTVTNPTQDRTITFPDETGTVALAENVAALSGATFSGTVSGTSLILSGNLTVNGTTTNINSTNLVVEDKNVVLGDVATPSDVTADGGGITLKGTTDKTFTWIDSTDAWTFSEHVNLVTGKSFKINNTAISAALPALTWGEVRDGKSGLVIS